MVEEIAESFWLGYKALLPKNRENNDPVLPEHLPYQGSVQGEFGLIPSEETCEVLRGWLKEKGDHHVLYFVTEGTTDEIGAGPNFKIGNSELTEETLAAINAGNESVIMAPDYAWAVFIDHEGKLHISGPNELADLLRNAII